MRANGDERDPDAAEEIRRLRRQLREYATWVVVLVAVVVLGYLFVAQAR